MAYDPAGKGVEWKKFWFHVGNFESPLPERIPGAPQVQESWSSNGPSGKRDQAEGTKGKNMIIGDERPLTVDDKILDREVV